MRLRYRIFLAIIIGGLSGTACYLRLIGWQKLAGDFTFSWRAAQYLNAGENPYIKIKPEGDYPFQTYFYYPLTTALVSLPFAFLPAEAAGGLFFALSSALLAFAISAQGWKHMPIFLSAPFVVAAATAQWSPLILAAGLIPPLAWLLTCKPNLGAAVFLYKPSWLGFSTIVIFILVSLFVFPEWPHEWWRVTKAIAGHPPPVLVFPLGPLLLLGTIAWRKPAGRLFLGLSIIPQLLFFYDQLPLWLIAPTFTSSLIFSGLSWVAYLSWRIWHVNPVTGEILNQPTQYILVLIYLPALILLLWQEREQCRLWIARFKQRFSPTK